MRSMRSVVLAAGLLIGLPLLVQGDDAAIPFNPVASAQKGDWAEIALTVTRGKLDEKKNFAPTGDPGQSVTHFEVLRVAGNGQVTVRIENVPADGTTDNDPIDQEFGAKDATIPFSFYNIPSASGVSAEADSVTTPDGRKFTCKKVTFKAGDLNWTLEVSPEVPCSGLVAISASSDTLQVSGQVSGFGNGSNATWGARKKK